jgi:NTE family protein
MALAGGGPLGFFYELGALHAVSEAVVGRALTEFDVYIGVSSGALVAAALANRLDTTAMGSIYVEDEVVGLPFSPGMLLQPAVGEYLRRIARLPKALTHVARQIAKDPMRNAWSVAMSSIGSLLPTALFDNKPLEHHLRSIFGAAGRTDDFRKLSSKLFAVATNLNTGESVAFGAPGFDKVPISRAVLASCALPGLYAAVEIEGEHYVDGALIRTMHASLALEEGCDLVICVNPLVPFTKSRAASSAHSNLADLGLPAILGQTFRALIYSRMQVGMAAYGARFPAADTVLLEPDRDDERLFFTNVFRYAGRGRLAEHAYQCTRRDLLAQADSLAPLLERHGLRLDTAVLRDPRRRFTWAGERRKAHVRATTARLSDALSRIEGLLR